MPDSKAISAYLAAEHRKKNRNPGRITELREELRDARLTEWVQRQLAAAPPLSVATRAKLAALLCAPGADLVGGDGNAPAA